MKHVRQQEYPTPAPGGDYGFNRTVFAGVNLRFVTVRTGDRAPSHGHDIPEELLLLSGKLRQNEHVLHPGDVLRTDAGEWHDFEALEDSRFLVVNPRD